MAGQEKPRADQDEEQDMLTFIGDMEAEAADLGEELAEEQGPKERARISALRESVVRSLDLTHRDLDRLRADKRAAAEVQLGREMLAANERMAKAAEDAARASADAARWAKWAAIFTAIAALGSVALGIVALLRSHG